MSTALKKTAQVYSQAFGEADAGLLLDQASRLRKAEKIRAVLTDEGMLPCAGMTVLDIGVSHGLILRRVVADGGLGIGVDLDRAALLDAAEYVSVALADGEQLPFVSHSFDVILCNHIYEHTDHPERLLAEVARLLKPNGVCYFAGPNKYALVEPHYGLPLLSWLPQPLADRYLRMLELANHYAIRPYSQTEMRRLLAPFKTVDYRAAVIADPVRYQVDDILPPGSIKQRIAQLILRFAPVIFTDYVIILRVDSAR